MHTELKLRQVSPERLLKDYTDRRLNFAMSRYGERVGRITTRISTAQRTSADLLCHITADLRPFGVVTAEASDDDAFAAIDRCISRLTRRCESKLARRRERRPARLTIRRPEHLAAA